MSRIQIIAILGSLFLLILICELMRRKRLKKEYSLLWLLTAFILLILSCFRHFLDWVGRAMGIYYSPSAFFLIFTFFLLLILLHFSIIISKLSEESKELAQQVAILERELKKKEEKEEGNEG